MRNDYSILYAEDDVDVRKNYVIYLQNYFKNIYEANDGKEALELFYKKKPNVVLLDITMPEINGLEVAKNIRLQDEKVPIIVLSAHSDKEFLLDAIKLNLVEYLIKPINRTEFKTLIEETLNKLESFNQTEQNVTIDRSTYWDRKNRLLFNKNKIVDLTKNETLLFELLLNKRNMLVKPTDIGELIWNNMSSENDASIRNLVKRLRKKLPVDIVQSIYGSGYIMNF